MYLPINQGVKVYLGTPGEEETQHLVDVNYMNGYTPYLDRETNKVYILVNNSGDVWRAPDAVFNSIPDGLYVFVKDESK